MKKTCNVVNKSAGRTGYTLKELNVRREFMPGEVKKNISVSELEMLSQRPGGKNILFNYLQVLDPEVITHLLNAKPPIEYWLTEEKLPSWIQNCSLDEFKDGLDFAPEGTKDLIKKMAVSMPITDTNKIKAIKDQLGFDVLKAIEMQSAFDDSGNAEDKAIVVTNTKPAARRATSSSISIPEEDK